MLPPGVCLGCLGPPWGLFKFFVVPYFLFIFGGCGIIFFMINVSNDDSSYYSSGGLGKLGFILNFVRSLGGVSSVLDVGCSNGLISHALGVELGASVRGIDLSERVSVPVGYDFVRDNIVTRGVVDVADVTLFLSLYHHILFLYGLDVADRLFFRLLSRCDVLLFDCGNVSEVGRVSFPWFGAQANFFRSELELLEHFGLPFEVVGSWRTGGGVRTVVAFRRSDLVESLEVVDVFKRLVASSSSEPVLFRVGEDVPVRGGRVFEDASFYRLRWGGFDFFGKFRGNSELLGVEFDNIRCVYGELDSSCLIPFYGVLGRFGLVFDWVEGLEFVRKPVSLSLSSGVVLEDVELWRVGGVDKFLDFER